jgi:hypothetical protein
MPAERLIEAGAKLAFDNMDNLLNHIERFKVN